MTSIEELAPGEFDLVASWLSSPNVNRWLTGEWRGRSVEAATIAIAVRNKRNRLFVVRYEGTPCGVAALADIEPADRTAMVWYLLGDSGLSGRSITTTAVKSLARLAFGQFGLVSLYAWIMEDNVRSRRVLERAGFKEAGRIRRATCSEGQQVDRVYFDLLASDLGPLSETGR